MTETEPTNLGHLEDSLEMGMGTPLIIVWDPSLISPEAYANLVKALGDEARLAGAAGITRLKPTEGGIMKFKWPSYAPIQIDTRNEMKARLEAEGPLGAHYQCLRLIYDLERSEAEVAALQRHIDGLPT